LTARHPAKVKPVKNQNKLSTGAPKLAISLCLRRSPERRLRDVRDRGLAALPGCELHLLSARSGTVWLPRGRRKNRRSGALAAGGSAGAWAAGPASTTRRSGILRRPQPSESGSHRVQVHDRGDDPYWPTHRRRSVPVRRAVLAALVTTSLASAINVATDLRSSWWAWIIVAGLTLLSAGVGLRTVSDG
jgi:hypothetical protein